LITVEDIQQKKVFVSLKNKSSKLHSSCLEDCFKLSKIEVKDGGYEFPDIKFVSLTTRILRLRQKPVKKSISSIVEKSNWVPCELSNFTDYPTCKPYKTYDDFKNEFQKGLSNQMKFSASSFCVNKDWVIPSRENGIPELYALGLGKMGVDFIECLNESLSVYNGVKDNYPQILSNISPLNLNALTIYLMLFHYELNSFSLETESIHSIDRFRKLTKFVKEKLSSVDLFDLDGDNKNNTPFIWSVCCKMLAFSRILLENGASIYHRDGDQCSALFWLLNGSSDDLNQILFNSYLNLFEKFSKDYYLKEKELGGFAKLEHRVNNDHIVPYHVLLLTKLTNALVPKKKLETEAEPESDKQCLKKASETPSSVSQTVATFTIEDKIGSVPLSKKNSLQFSIQITLS
jgi:hypothetical protein